MEKTLYQAPQGLEAIAQEPDLQIEIEDPESVKIGIGGVELEIQKDEGDDFDDNIAEEMGENELQSLASELLSDFDTDLSSRKDWLDVYVKGLKLLGLKHEDRTEPWPGACGVFHPMLMESAVKFQSETIMETFPAAGPVRTKIIGKAIPVGLPFLSSSS